MKFKLDDEQQMLQDSVRRFLDKAYTFEARVAARKGGASAGNWQAFADNGWLAAAIPEAYGGLGGSIVDTVLIAQAFGRSLVVEPFLGCAVLAAQTFLVGAGAAQREALLPALADGSQLLALAYSEPQARGNPAVVAARAEAIGPGFVLSGCKTLVLGGVSADRYLVSAAIAGTPGVSLFLVDKASPGLQVRALPLHDGSEAAELVLGAVPASLVGVAGNGLQALRHGLSHAVAALCAELVGAMEAAIDMTADYLKIRQQFGVAIGSFQALQHRLVDMAAEMELSRSMLYALLASLENDGTAQQEVVVSQAKSLIGRLAKSVCGQAIQLHGGIGMTDEYVVGHYFKRAVVADVLFGSSDQHDAACAAAHQPVR
ncbi:acyl-CoA dehydrogenase [Paraburkholderia ginsengiterrae]|uniref:Acyl-CoA dehydrogenase n=1 Tax=Paraburkholderia ginsengiterrae TaxID=1462993 RepID=A0A1A9NAE3_9BURK|nr:acyl-CoA dehydrogenase family protein [Paraburkholderia ginsengiterrae]OAJ51634.1 acyl-CoA dehydrogenase [Paraburkholderia ginsengiterrae]OAJ61821.1 acyl-CoA dehydrogenase [Paraburkholderia ginsengiterrae]